MPQSTQPRLSELRVGLLVLAALAILAVVIFALSGDISLPWLNRKTTGTSATRYMSHGCKPGAPQIPVVAFASLARPKVRPRYKMP